MCFANYYSSYNNNKLFDNNLKNNLWVYLQLKN